jgi:hypothetical protein
MVPKNRVSDSLVVLLCLGICVFGIGNVDAACSGVSPTWTSTADYTSVNSCVSQAKAGDTINVIAGSGSVTWPASAVTIPVAKPLNILGPGINNLVITLGGNYVFTIDPYIGTSQLPATRISGFTFYNASGNSYSAILAKGQGWRVDHNKMNNVSSSAAPLVEATGQNTGGIEPFGLVDNNILINGKILNQGMGGTGFATVWSSALTLGAASSGHAVYVEDNVFYGTISPPRLAVDANRGGKYVFRYNTLTDYDVLAHGLQASDERGTRSWEIYGNKFKSTTSANYDVIDLKAGTGVVFYNDFTSSVPYDIYIHLQHERETTSNDITWICNGDSIWDGNTSPKATYAGWPCRDQIGTSTDASYWYPQVSGGSPTRGPAQTLAPAYFWVNLDNGVKTYATVDANAQVHIKANRDFYEQGASFNGTSGVGCGTLANRPACASGCTIGVSYWVTNQSCTNMTSMIGQNPSTPINGTLYKLTANGVWTEYYTPYAYPHPLSEPSGQIKLRGTGN